jgi:hypothetical protein
MGRDRRPAWWSGGVVLEKKSVSPLIDGRAQVPPLPSLGVNMTQHYNRPPLDPVHVYIQPVATTPAPPRSPDLEVRP